MSHRVSIGIVAPCLQLMGLPALAMPPLSSFSQMEQGARSTMRPNTEVVNSAGSEFKGQRGVSRIYPRKLQVDERSKTLKSPLLKWSGYGE